ncbi:hypothetical protein SE959_15835 [Escherichia coli]|nr:hypothetical protein [Escherichia coli]
MATEEGEWNSIFSPSNNAFYPASLRSVYEAAGSWPEDSVVVASAVYKVFSASAAPAGMERCGAGEYADLERCGATISGE